MDTILITGTNRGIGLGLLKRYLEAGKTVYATARKPSEIEAFQALAAQFGDSFRPLALDLEEDASIHALVTQLEGVTLDALIHNAACCLDEGLGEWTAAGMEKTFRVNVVAIALLTQALLTQVKDGGKIIHISSGAGSMALNINPLAPMDVYTMSKAALNIYSLRLAEKLRERGIVVVAMSPGWVRTDMGGPEATASIEEATKDLVQTINGLAVQDSGRFISERGETIPW
ncbi:MAG: SDR family oxidoreductase [Coraliomargaritaceae bacterium]